MGMHKRKLSLDGDIIPRTQPRTADQRTEDRLEDVVDRAMITFRGQEHLVPVVNISARGTMVECDIMPRIGEAVIVQFENCTKIHGFVRWIRDGRLGINFGHEIILG